MTALLLMVAYGATIGGMATLVGTPPNILVAGFLDTMCDVKVGFVGWLLFGVPIALVLFVVSIVWTWLVLGRHRGHRHQPAHMHQKPAVALDHDDLSPGLSAREPERHGQGQAHRVLEVEVLGHVSNRRPEIRRVAERGDDERTRRQNIGEHAVIALAARQRWAHHWTSPRDKRRTNGAEDSSA